MFELDLVLFGCWAPEADLKGSGFWGCSVQCAQRVLGLLGGIRV